MNTENVDYYVTFDNFKVGVLQGQYIEEKLGLKEEKGPFNIELLQVHQMIIMHISTGMVRCLF